MESTPEETAEGLAIVRVLGAVLDRLVCANAPIALTDPGHITKFHAVRAHGTSIHQYLERIHKYASCSNESFILAFIYIDRLIQRNNFLLTDLNVHRVVITAVLLAAKFVDDAYYNNAYYAKVGGVMTAEINGLEVDFLFRINFSLNVTSEEYDQYRSELVAHLARTSVFTQQIRSSPILTPTSQHQAIAAAAASFSTQVAIQHAMERQNQVGRYTVDAPIHDEFVHRIASQITPSPAGNPIEGNHQLMMSTMLHPNSSIAAEDALAAANSNFIMQSLEFLQQSIETNSSGTNVVGYPVVHRTHSLPVKVRSAEFSQYHLLDGYSNQQNATFANIVPQQSCQATSQNRLPYSYPMDDPYLRLLIEGNQQQEPQPYNNIQLQQTHSHTNLHCHPIINTTTTQTSDSRYNNMIVLQNEARQLFAAAGLSGAVLS